MKPFPLKAQPWLGLDIGGTKIEALVVNDQDQVLGQAIVPTATATPDHLCQSISAAATQALTQAQSDFTQVAAVGMGIPGQVNPDTGEVTLAVNLNLSNFPLGAVLSHAWGKPCFLENDVRAAAVGAYFHLTQPSPLTPPASALRHIAYLSIGTGIAAGIILDGRLHRGANGMAGEVGHIPLDLAGERCACGQTGCLETIAAGPAIVRQAAQVGLKVSHAGEVYAAASHGHPQAQAIIQRVSLSLGRAIQWLIMTCDVEKVVLGGGVTRSGATFLEPICHALAQLRAHSPLAQTLLATDKITLIPPGFNAGVWGAIALARQK